MNNSDIRHRESAVLILLGLAFLAVLAGPYIWISELETAYSAKLAVAQVSERLKYLWPLSVLFFIGLSACIHLNSRLKRRIVFMFVGFAALSTTSVFATFQATKLTYLLGLPMMYLVVLPIGLVAAWCCWKFCGWVHAEETTGENIFWSKALFASAFLVPQPLCQFGFLFNHHWHLALP